MKKVKGDETEGRRNKDFKKEERLGQGVHALKGMVRAGTPLRTMLLVQYSLNYQKSF